jgi:hypothetical protein
MNQQKTCFYVQLKNDFSDIILYDAVILDSSNDCITVDVKCPNNKTTRLSFSKFNEFENTDDVDNDHVCHIRGLFLNIETIISQIWIMSNIRRTFIEKKLTSFKSNIIKMVETINGFVGDKMANS